MDSYSRLPKLKNGAAPRISHDATQSLIAQNAQPPRPKPFTYN